MQIKKLLALIFLVLISSFVSAEVDCEIYAENDYKSLKKVNYFSGEYVGIGGAEPDHIKALKCLHKEKNADQIYKRLLDESLLPGKIYAMMGLYEIDKKAFNDNKPIFESNKIKVDTWFGCIVSNKSVNELFKDIDSGKHIDFFNEITTNKDIK